MDEFSSAGATVTAFAHVPERGQDLSLDSETMKACLDFLFQAAVEQEMPLVASLIGAASDAVEENLRQRSHTYKV